MSKILIIGASSGIGLQTCKVALDNGHEVVAFSRHAEQMTVENEHLTKFSGDATNFQDIERAMHDVDVVIQSLGVPMNLKLITGPITLFSKATEVMLQAMSKNHIKRLLTVTGFGAGDSIHSIHPLQKIGFNMVFGRAYADKDTQEQLIKDSECDWTIIRPGVLTNCTKEKPYRVLKNKHEWKNGIISRLNVAKFIVASINNSEMIGAEPVLIT